jgi:MoxR-like ATPase
VMEENRVTIDGEPHPVGRPFMVVATQNPIEQAGTYRLPEAQLDRFLMKTAMGYPDREATIELLVNAKVRDRASLIEPVITAQAIAQMSGLADDVYVDTAVVSYVAELAEESRRQPHVRLGLSARGCLALIRVAKTWAAAEGRNHVLPDDIKELAQPVLCHRLLLDAEAQFSGVTVDDVIGRLLDSVSPPTDRVG